MEVSRVLVLKMWEILPSGDIWSFHNYERGYWHLTNGSPGEPPDEGGHINSAGVRNPDLRESTHPPPSLSTGKQIVQAPQNMTSPFFFCHFSPKLWDSGWKGNSEILWDSSGTYPFYDLLFSGGKRLQPPWPSLSSKGLVQIVASQGREEMQRQMRSSQERIVQPWGRVLVPP